MRVGGDYGGSASASAVYSPREVWATDPIYGWNGVSTSDIGPALNLAIAAAVADGRKAVHLPELTAALDTRVFVPSNFDIISAGIGKTVLNRTWKGGFNWGLTLPTSTANWATVTGLDASVVVTRKSFRTCPPGGPNCDIIYPLTSLSFGHQTDYWDNSPALTVDFCLDLGVSGTFATGQLFGAMNGAADPEPWYAFVDTGPVIKFKFSLATGDEGLRDVVGISFPVTSHTGLIKISVQVNLDAATVLAYVDRVPVTATVYGGGANFTPGRRLLAPRTYPFKIGAAGTDFLGWTHGSIAVTVNALDRTFVGLKVSNQLLYTTSGGVQVRIDGTLNDHKQFFEYESGKTMAVADWQVASAMPELKTGTADITRTIGYVFEVDAVRTWSDGNHISGLSLILSGGHSAWGSALTLGAVTNFVGEDIRIIDGFHAIGALQMGAAYPITFNNVYVRGSDAGLYFDFCALLFAHLLTIENPGRYGVLLTRSLGSFDHVAVHTPTTDSQAIFRSYGGEAGGVLIVNDVFLNNESGDRVSKGMVWIDAHSGPPLGSTHLAVSNVGGNNLPVNVPVVRLGGTHAGGVNNPNIARIDGVWFGSRGFLLPVTVDAGATWTTRVNGDAYTP